MGLGFFSERLMATVEQWTVVVICVSENHFAPVHPWSQNDIHNNQKGGMAQVSLTGEWANETGSGHTVEYYSALKAGHSDTCYSTDGPQGHRAECNRPDEKDQHC